MNIIRILPENVASQIAAGEVIDRPASVVRELVDNSIDAGADRIIVRVENGGKGLIRVSDNGSGMSRDDLLLSIERHATSKIEDASDINAVKTLGFRGEAIPSIASVSRMQITSRPKEQIQGYRLRITGGKLNSVEEAGVPAGSIVEVRDLFFNLPARRKFLRAPRTELDHVLDTLARAVLPFPQISFKLEDSGKTVMNFPSSDLMLPRLFALLGRKTVEAMVESGAKDHGLSVTAYLAPPEMSRARGDHLFVYVNGRNIRDRLITKAIIEGYGQRLMKGRYPQAALFMVLDPSFVDVNVHPTKQEVRFQESRTVFNAVFSLVNKALSELPNPLMDQETQKRGNVEIQSPRERPVFVSEPVQNYFRTLGQDTARASSVNDAPSVFEIAPKDTAPVMERPGVIGQLKNTYILCQAKDGLLLIDQHAAHERIVYENLKRGFHASRIEGQTLLIPHELEFSVKETGIAIEKRESLSRMGFELDHFGGNTFLLRSHPAILKDVQWDTFFPEVLAELGQGKTGDEAVLDKSLAVMACHGAIRAGTHMTREEMVHLVSQLREADLPTNCPHGRPVFKHFSFYEIEKMFKRVV